MDNAVIGISKDAVENPSHPFYAQWLKVVDAITTIEMLLPTFKHEPNSIGVALDRLEVISIAFRGRKRTLPLGYKRPEGPIL